MSSTFHTTDRVTPLLARQDGVARLDQLGFAGMSAAYLHTQLAWGRWQRPCHTVVVTHNGPLTPAQEIHESRRYFPTEHPHPSRLPPMSRLDRSIVDAAVWTKQPRSACGLVIAAVPQRLTQPARLLVELTKAGKVRHHRVLRAVLADVEGGAQALSEVDFARLCRRHGIPSPLHQSVRLDSQGRRRYIDVQMRTRRGKRLAVEIDGAAHLIVGSYWQDMARGNEIVLSGQSLLRFPTVALYLDEATVIDQLRRAVND
jgi:hypothetical protein